jgi:SEC-C motif-containing protein
LDACCGPIIDGAHAAETAEALMRSRYTAHVLDRRDYLRASWHPRTRPAHADTAADAMAPTRWLGLRILATEAGTAGDAAGTVEFIARYKVGGRAFRLHEISRFERDGGRWLYVEAIPDPTDDRPDVG